MKKLLLLLVFVLFANNAKASEFTEASDTEFAKALIMKVQADSMTHKLASPELAYKFYRSQIDARIQYKLRNVSRNWQQWLFDRVQEAFDYSKQWTKLQEAFAILQLPFDCNDDNFKAKYQYAVETVSAVVVEILAFAGCSAIPPYFVLGPVCAPVGYVIGAAVGVGVYALVEDTKCKGMTDADAAKKLDLRVRALDTK